MHGRDRPRFSTQTRHAVQQQFACSELGHNNGIKEILRSRTTGPSTSTPPVHIPGIENALTDIPSRSFGSVKSWECKSDDDVLTLFNKTFPLPQQASWTIFRLSTKVTTRMISALRMQGTTSVNQIFDLGKFI